LLLLVAAACAASAGAQPSRGVVCKPLAATLSKGSCHKAQGLGGAGGVAPPAPLVTKSGANSAIEGYQVGGMRSGWGHALSGPRRDAAVPSATGLSADGHHACESTGSPRNPKPSTGPIAVLPPHSPYSACPIRREAGAAGELAAAPVKVPTRYSDTLPTAGAITALAKAAVRVHPAVQGPACAPWPLAGTATTGARPLELSGPASSVWSAALAAT
jgi:hypothetical protein